MNQTHNSLSFGICHFQTDWAQWVQRHTCTAWRSVLLYTEIGGGWEGWEVEEVLVVGDVEDVAAVCSFSMAPN